MAAHPLPHRARRPEGEFEDLGPAAAEWQKKLEDAASGAGSPHAAAGGGRGLRGDHPVAHQGAQGIQQRARGAASGDWRKGEISQKDFDKAVEIAKENFEEATKAIDDMSVFAEEAARNMQDAFADFLFDPFEDGLEGMLEGFADTLRRMAAEVVAAQIAEKFNFEDIFKGGGIFGGGGGGRLLAGASGGGGGVLGRIAITAQRMPEPGRGARRGG